MFNGFRALTLLCALIVATVRPAAAQITDVSSENKAVNAAIEKAQSTLPVFFKRLEKPERGDSGFLVKIKFAKAKGDGGNEYIWAKDIVRAGDTVSATIDNDPRDIPNLVTGQRVTVSISDVSDWLYSRDGKYRGAYTVRALVPFMTPDQAADMKKRLGPE
jgi:uncharacterized protein YegJ (DUF2314 family)